MFDTGFGGAAANGRCGAPDDSRSPPAANLRKSAPDMSSCCVDRGRAYRPFQTATRMVPARRRSANIASRRPRSLMSVFMPSFFWPVYSSSEERPPP